MQNNLSYIETANRKYPIVFNINVMESIQEAYGSVKAWGEKVENADGGEPRVKELKIGLMLMINEGIDIENEQTNQSTPPLTAKQVGRLIGDVGFKAITEVIKNLTIASTQTGDNEGKNE